MKATLTVELSDDAWNALQRLTRQIGSEGSADTIGKALALLAFTMQKKQGGWEFGVYDPADLTTLQKVELPDEYIKRTKNYIGAATGHCAKCRAAEIERYDRLLDAGEQHEAICKELQCKHPPHYFINE